MTNISSQTPRTLHIILSDATDIATNLATILADTMSVSFVNTNLEQPNSNILANNVINKDFQSLVTSTLHNSSDLTSDFLSSFCSSDPADPLKSSWLTSSAASSGHHSHWQISQFNGRRTLKPHHERPPDFPKRILGNYTIKERIHIHRCSTRISNFIKWAVKPTLEWDHHKDKSRWSCFKEREGRHQ